MYKEQEESARKIFDAFGKEYTKNLWCFSRSKLPNYCCDQSEITPVTTILLRLMRHAKEGGTFGLGKNRTFQVFQDLGYLDSEGNPNKNSLLFYYCWNEAIHGVHPEPNEPAETIVKNFYTAYNKNKLNSGFFSRSNLPKRVRYDETPWDDDLYKLIKHAKEGGTFGFGKNRTLQVFQDLGYLDSEGNPVEKFSPTFYTCWNEAIHGVHPKP